MSFKPNKTHFHCHLHSKPLTYLKFFLPHYFLCYSLWNTHKTNTHKQLFINISCNGARNEKNFNHNLSKANAYLFNYKWFHYTFFFSSNKATKKSFCTLSHSLNTGRCRRCKKWMFYWMFKGAANIEFVAHFSVCFCLDLDEHWYFACFSHFLRIQT